MSVILAVLWMSEKFQQIDTVPTNASEMGKNLLQVLGLDLLIFTGGGTAYIYTGSLELSLVFSMILAMVLKTDFWRRVSSASDSDLELRNSRTRHWLYDMASCFQIIGMSCFSLMLDNGGNVTAPILLYFKCVIVVPHFVLIWSVSMTSKGRHVVLTVCKCVASVFFLLLCDRLTTHIIRGGKSWVTLNRLYAKHDMAIYVCVISSSDGFRTPSSRYYRFNDTCVFEDKCAYLFLEKYYDIRGKISCVISSFLTIVVVRILAGSCLGNRISEHNNNVSDDVRQESKTSQVNLLKQALDWIK